MRFFEGAKLCIQQQDRNQTIDKRGQSRLSAISSTKDKVYQVRDSWVTFEKLKWEKINKKNKQHCASGKQPSVSTVQLSSDALLCSCLPSKTHHYVFLVTVKRIMNDLD
jgi:hypothetical protein